MTIFIGADPEVFVKKDGKIISGYNLIPGTKEKPHLVPNGAVQVDGMALEFNIEPAKSSTEFVSNISFVLAALRQMIPGHELSLEAIAQFEPSYLKKQPREAIELGCDPDFNAYTVRRNKSPDQTKSFRTAAGHIHIGWTKNTDIYDLEHIQKCVSIVKNLDITLGVPSILFDSCSKRRELYGRAGAFRPKSYGVEYRVLSNKWLQSVKLMEFIYQTAFKTVDNFLNGKSLLELIPNAEKCINNSDRKTAIQIIKIVGMTEPDYVLELGRC